MPPTAYRMPLTAATPKWERGVGIDAFAVHVSVLGSYASTGAGTRVPTVAPPTAYRAPLIAVTPKECLGVSIGAFPVQLSVAGSYA